MAQLEYDTAAWWVKLSVRSIHSPYRPTESEVWRFDQGILKHNDASSDIDPQPPNIVVVEPRTLERVSDGLRAKGFGRAFAFGRAHWLVGFTDTCLPGYLCANRKCALQIRNHIFPAGVVMAAH